MKVLLINGSPHKNGNTSEALAEVARTLEGEGIETETAWVGTKPIRGCIACMKCFENGNNRCVFDDDVVNRILEKAEGCDGLVVGTPVYYAGMNGALAATLQRMFYAGGSLFAYKPAAGIAVARRTGASTSADQINKYFQINNMPVVSSCYWGVAYGRLPGEAVLDAEGMRTMRGVGRNMAWLLKCIEAGRETSICLPESESKPLTNMIRDDLK